MPTFVGGRKSRFADIQLMNKANYREILNVFERPQTLQEAAISLVLQDRNVTDQFTDEAYCNEAHPTKWTYDPHCPLYLDLPELGVIKTSAEKSSVAESDV